MAVVAFGAAGPAQAAPGGDATIVEVPLSVAVGAAEGGAVARCPAGQRVVGGGVGTTSDSVNSQVLLSAPVDETGTTAETVAGDVARGWSASVRNGGTARPYKVFALCSATSDATIAAVAFNVTMGIATGGAVAVCPAGRRVVGGGVGSTTPVEVDPPLAVQVSGPVDETGATANTAAGDVARGWRANVENVSAEKTFKVFALCSATSDATIAEAAFDLAGPSQPAGFEVATCPAGRRVLGGGVGTTAATVASVVELSEPLDETGTTANTTTGDVARSWSADVFNNDSSPFNNNFAPSTYKVFALCAADDPAVGVGGPGAGGPGAGGPGAGPLAPGPGAGPDATKPLLSALSVLPRAFRAASSGPSIATRGGSRVSYTISESAAVIFRVEQARAGRRVGASCVRPTKANRRRQRCTRYLTLSAGFTHPGATGTNTFRFSGRLGGRRLAPGRYRLRATATDPSAGTARPKRSFFTILPRR